MQETSENDVEWSGVSERESERERERLRERGQKMRHDDDANDALAVCTCVRRKERARGETKREA